MESTSQTEQQRPGYVYVGWSACWLRWAGFCSVKGEQRETGRSDEETEQPPWKGGNVQPN